MTLSYTGQPLMIDVQELDSEVVAQAVTDERNKLHRTKTY